MCDMDTFKQVIDSAGPRADLAQALGVGVRAVSHMRTRDWIEPRYWRRLRGHMLARGQMLESSTLEMMAERRG